MLTAHLQLLPTKPAAQDTRDAGCSKCKPYLMLVNPPGRGHYLGIPGCAATHTCTACLRDAEWGDCLLRLMILHNGGGCTVQISVHVQVTCSGNKCLRIHLECCDKNLQQTAPESDFDNESLHNADLCRG